MVIISFCDFCYIILYITLFIEWQDIFLNDFLNDFLNELNGSFTNVLKLSSRKC